MTSLFAKHGNCLSKHPVTRDDFNQCAVYSRIVPFVIAAADVPELRCPQLSHGVVFSELSKLLNQENALSVPC